MSDLGTFRGALDDAQRFNKRHVLLGNGFSIACRPDSFAYGRLLDEATFDELSVGADQLFALSGTADFERAIEMLRTTQSVLGLYAEDQSELLMRLADDAECVKDALAEVLARKHPDHVHAIDAAEYSAARTFLSQFDGKIFTVNYDLLLYWALIQDELEPALETDDGFRADPDDPDADYVVWDPSGPIGQRVYFLHGGLHLFDSGAQLVKLTFSRTGVHLIDQIRENLDRGLYPRVVTEGTSNEKLTAIVHSAYLSRGLRSLAQCGGALFVYGHSLAESDAHVLRCISDGKFKALYVSLYGDFESAENVAVRARAQSIAATRPPSRSLEVHFFDADSAAVWST